MIGLCECGCGEATSLALQTKRAKGHVKGQPMRFVVGHNAKPKGVEYLVDEATGCWLWQRTLNNHGYGTAGRMFAHRVMYERLVGPIPPGLELDHIVCDNPPCVNPAHLKPVTHAQNIQRARHTKLTMDKARMIRELCAMGFKKVDVAAYYEVHVNRIFEVLRDAAWVDPDAHATSGSIL